MPKTFPFSQKLSNYCFLDCPHTHWKSRVEALESELEWIRGARFYKGWRKCNVNASDREELPVPSSWNLVYVFVCVLFSFFAEPTASTPFLTAPCYLCPASDLSLLVDYIYLHPSHLSQLIPSFPLPTLVGPFLLSSPVPSLHSLLAKPDRGPYGTISLSHWAQFNSQLCASLTPAITRSPLCFSLLFQLFFVAC